MSEAQASTMAGQQDEEECQPSTSKEVVDEIDKQELDPEKTKEAEGGGSEGGEEPVEPEEEPGDEIDAPLYIVQPGIDFHQLDSALQHVQGHMDSMMHNLGGLQSSVKNLKRNSEKMLNYYLTRSSEVDRNALRLR